MRKAVASHTAMIYHPPMYDEPKAHDFIRLGRAESRALTRKRLRMAAIEEIAARGVAGLSIEKISERAGLTRGAFYYNYDSKYALLSDVLVVASDIEINLWIKLSEEVDDIDDLFPLLKERVDNFFGERGLLLVELEMEARRSDEFSTYFRDSERKVQMACERMVAALAHKAGVFIDVSLAATMVSSMASGLALCAPRSDGLTRGAILIRLLKLLLKS